MNIAALPKGAMLTYPYGQSQTPDGRVLEDNGVVPDIEVALDREALLRGVDTQLAAAVDHLAKQASLSWAEVPGRGAGESVSERR